MADLFVDDEEVIEVMEGFEEEEAQVDIMDTGKDGLDARRRLEHMLDEKRLRNELDDFIDY